ncbi:MAG: 50S ribosomal protein L29 [Desulfobulbaceae bacterium]|nr:50S ribosomal protein L29 [Desulfobulbaceae bacterium]MCK5404237.1 50S ribosomal protein L29 [Desulfobulbaceae bacterium]
MRASEIRALSDNELAGKETELSEELFRLRFQHGIRPLENTARLKALKKDISRVKTILTEREKSE